MNAERCDYHTAKGIIENNHYSHKMPQAVKECYAIVDSLFIIGIVVYSIPANRYMFSCVGLDDGWELSRLWLKDGMKRNTLSHSVAQTLKAVQPDNIMSYADAQYGHCGYIYQALNFIYLGKTKPEKRYLIDGKLITRRGLGRRKGITEKEHREQILNSGGVEFLSAPKHKYLYLRDRRQRRQFCKEHTIIAYPKQEKPSD